jgi:hypothetical protein
MRPIRRVPPEDLVASVAAEDDFDVRSGELRDQIRRQVRGVGHGLVELRERDVHDVDEVSLVERLFDVLGADLTSELSRVPALVERWIVERDGKRAQRLVRALLGKSCHA